MSEEYDKLLLKDIEGIVEKYVDKINIIGYVAPNTRISESNPYIEFLWPDSIPHVQYPEMLDAVMTVNQCKEMIYSILKSRKGEEMDAMWLGQLDEFKLRK